MDVLFAIVLLVCICALIIRTFFPAPPMPQIIYIQHTNMEDDSLGCLPLIIAGIFVLVAISLVGG